MNRYRCITVLLAVSSLTPASAEQQVLIKPSSTSEPDWFQTRPQSFQGPTATGAAPFLAQTNPAPFGHTTYTANYPLETSEPIHGAHGRNAFHFMGNLTPYYPGEVGYGVDEYPRPAGSEITQMHLLHRHGSRYPSSGEKLGEWGEKIMNATAQGTVFTHSLEFLNDWTYGLGAEILVTRGRQELFDSGVLNFFNYGALYNNSDSKIVVRTTTQDRMMKSAENFLSGFFGLEWTENAKLLAMIESTGFNTSLMASYACINSDRPLGNYSAVPVTEWKDKYLRQRTDKLRQMTGEYEWTVSDSYNAQSLCAYETVSLGFSPFCQLFNYEEWEGFSYSSDIWFSSSFGFLSPVGRAQGITWVEEFLARVEGRPFNASNPTAANLTLNTNPVTFPLNQSLYLDFAHDSILVSVLTAFGFTQFSEFLPVTGPPSNRQFRSSKLIPFAARINIEIIKTPYAVNHRRSRNPDVDPYVPGTGETLYVHFLLNQRTIPLHSSFDACDRRDDGWCELSTFLDIQRKSLEKARFEYSCTGDWDLGEYGSVRDGVPAK